MSYKFNEKWYIQSKLAQCQSTGQSYLKGAFGDAINALLASAAFNFQKWCNKLDKHLTA